MAQGEAGVNGLSRHKHQCAHWYLFHGPIDTDFPCESGNQRKQQRGSCLRRLYSMERKAVENFSFTSTAETCYNREREKTTKTEVTAMLTQEDLQVLEALFDKKLEPIKQDISGLKTEVSGMKADISGLKNDMAEVKESLAEVREATNYIAEWVDKVENKVDRIAK